MNPAAAFLRVFSGGEVKCRGLRTAEQEAGDKPNDSADVRWIKREDSRNYLASFQRTGQSVWGGVYKTLV